MSLTFDNLKHIIVFLRDLEDTIPKKMRNLTILCNNPSNEFEEKSYASYYHAYINFEQIYKEIKPMLEYLTDLEDNKLHCIYGLWDEYSKEQISILLQGHIPVEQIESVRECLTFMEEYTKEIPEDISDEEDIQKQKTFEEEFYKKFSLGTISIIAQAHFVREYIHFKNNASLYFQSIADKRKC